MSRDIRSYFGGGAVKPKPTRISDGDSPRITKNKDSNVKGRHAKAKTIIIDSDSDDEPIPPSPKRQKQSSSSGHKKEPSKNSTKNLTPVNIADVFGKTPVQRVDAKPPKVKSPANVDVKKEKDSPKKVCEASDESSQESIEVIATRKGKHRNSHGKEEKASREGTLDIQGKHAKGDAKFKGSKDEECKTSTVSPIRTKNIKEEGSKESPKQTEKKRPHLAEVKSSGDKDGAKREAIQKMSPRSIEKQSPKLEEKKTPKEESKKMKVSRETESEKIDGYDEEHKHLDESEKKKQRAMMYQKYLHREGPRNPGSKEIPKGHPNCLAGMTFIITGVLESIDRDEAASVIQSCGGKVTTSLSRNTSYIVLGSEPGPSKLEKARNLGTKELDEDSLLDLIRTKTQEMGGSAAPGSGDKKIKIEEDDGASPSAAKRLKLLQDNGEDKKAPLSRKLQYLSQSCNVPQLTVAKGSMETTIKAKGKDPVVSSTTSKKVEKTGSVSRDEKSDTVKTGSENTMWVDRYKPMSVKQIIGQQGEKSNVNKLTRWLSNWNRYHGPGGKRPPRPGPWDKNDDGGHYKAALLSGPPGVGKTTSALLVCKELGMDAVELNASDTRSKKLLESEVSELISSNSLSGYFQADKKKPAIGKKVLVMDEVDGMAGNEDRGGVAALIQLIKTSCIPIICICNDRAHPKIRSLVNYCFDLRFQRPRMEQIRGAMMSICFKEGVKMSPEVLANLISSTNQDVRQVLHQLNIWSAVNEVVPKAEEPSTKRKAGVLKDVRLGPWDVLRKVFSAEERRNTTINQQSELFFYDYNLGPLFVFENYPKVSPNAGKTLKDRLSLLAQTAEALAMGNIIERKIRKDQAWKLLPSQAIFSSVLPGALMEGHMTGQIDFPAYLGKTSTKGKMERLAQEIALHTRVATGATKNSIKLDYLSYLRDAIINPLVEESQEQSRGGGGGENIQKSLDVMQCYSLLREDLDSILELSHFPGRPDPMAMVTSKVKSAFTRAYNKEGIMTPYSVTMAVKKKRGGGGSSEDMYGDEEEEGGEEGGEEEEQEEGIDTDAMIKVKKPSARGGGAAVPGGSRGRGAKKDDAPSEGKGKGRGKGAGRGGRGGKKNC